MSNTCKNFWNPKIDEKRLTPPTPSFTQIFFYQNAGVLQENFQTEVYCLRSIIFASEVYFWVQYQYIYAIFIVVLALSDARVGTGDFLIVKPWPQTLSPKTQKPKNPKQSGLGLTPPTITFKHEGGVPQQNSNSKKGSECSAKKISGGQQERKNME